MSDGLDQFKEAVRSRSDIVEVISESVALVPRRGGREYAGLCPFHDDRNPSMMVYPDRQSFKCWSCGAGGDVFGFVMQHDGLEFPRALEQLAERAGLEMPQRSRHRRGPSKEDRDRRYELLDWVQSELHAFLTRSREGQVARDYLESRGVSPEFVEQFRIGFHPGGRDWLVRRGEAAKRFRPADFYATGIARDWDGRPSDELLFKKRLVFPIRDERGRCVAFGGRVIPGVDYDIWGDRKYVNSGDNPLFPKSRTLYGLDLAKAAIRRPDPHRIAVVMEGFTDVIAAHQAGVTNAVAPLGTAMTDEHVALLKRFAERIVLVFDGDQAGRSAARRAVEKVLAADVDVRVLSLPDGADPAEFLASHGADAFRSLIEAAPDAVAFQVEDSLARVDADTPDGRQKTADEVLTTLAATRSAGSRRVDAVLATLADRLLINEAALRERLSELRSRGSMGTATNRVDRPAEPAGGPHGLPEGPDTDPLEREILATAMHRPELFDALRTHVGPDDFRPGPLRGLFERMIDVAEIEGPPAYALLINTLETQWAGLLVSIDVEARDKRLTGDEEKTNGGAHDGSASEDPGRTDSAGPLPPVLARAVAALRRRRQRDEFERSKGRIARKRVTDGDVLDEGMKDLLRRADTLRRDRDAATTR